MVSVISAAIVAKKVVKNDFMYRGIILLGTNLGDKYRNLVRAQSELSKDCEVFNESAIYETPAWGYESSETYFNQALECRFEKSPADFLRFCLDVEKKMGRTRVSDGYADRTIDIDIIAIENFTCEAEDLIVPHPRLQLRKFVLLPLQDLWPDWEHPILQKSVKSLFEECPDPVQPKKKYHK